MIHFKAAIQLYKNTVFLVFLREVDKNDQGNKNSYGSIS